MLTLDLIHTFYIAASSAELGSMLVVDLCLIIDIT